MRSDGTIDPDGSVVCWNLVTGEVVAEPDGSFDQVAVVPAPYEEAFTSEACGMLDQINVFSRDEWGTGYSKLAAGDDVPCALRADGSIALLSESDGAATTAPSSERFVDISGGPDFCCGLSSEGQYRCFGAIIH